jgi:hypothetical protein
MKAQKACKRALKVAQKQQEKEERALLKTAQKSLAKHAYSRPPEARKVPLKTPKLLLPSTQSNKPKLP